jgi:hypothetical protein
METKPDIPLKDEDPVFIVAYVGLWFCLAAWVLAFLAVLFISLEEKNPVPSIAFLGCTGIILLAASRFIPPEKGGPVEQ